jgi:hypothetical protein
MNCQAPTERIPKLCSKNASPITTMIIPIIIFLS